jgi:hypothetical protein
MKRILTLLIVSLLFFGCNDTTSKEATNNVTEPPVINTDTLQNLPSLSVEDIEGLMNNTDRIDYIFYNYGKSINQTEKLSIQNMVRQITTIPQEDINCSIPFCKIIFYKTADKLLEGEIHFGNGCAYFVFSDAEGKPQYAGKMGDSGILFFNDLIANFNAATGQ